MRTLGIDLASDPRNTGCCLLEWTAGGPELRELEVGADDNRLLELHGQADVTGIDCPFGWPTAFLAFLCATSRPTGEPMPGWSREHRDGLRFRVTDFRVRRELKRWPLSVSSDLIAVAALRCQGLLTRMGVTDRSGDGRVYEVYPAAALKQWGLPSRGYKTGKGMPQRQELVRELQEKASWLRVGEDHQRTLVTSDHALDAMIASLNARAARLGLTIKPGEDEHRAAVREGWIAIPEEGSLEKLLGPRVSRV
jgi:predicted nuclease with RNAse H fold